jgi:hypothetical protein
MSDAYRFGCITIAGKDYRTDVLVYPDRVEDQWWRKEGHRLCLDDLKGVLGEHPDTLVVGTGYLGRMAIDQEVPEALEKQGITLLAHTTGKAWTEFNRLKGSQKVVAALHLTC